MKAILAIAAALMFAAACGKKAPLRPPGSERPPASAPAGDDATDGPADQQQPGGGAS